MPRSSWMFTLLAVLLLTPALSADEKKTEFGPRAGFGGNPDQFVIGAQAIFGQTLKIFRFAPSVDLGFGDNVTTYNVNGDLQFSLTPPGASTAFYVAAGPTITHFTADGGDDTEVGLSAVGGLMMPFGSSSRYNLEFRAGIGDIPDYRVLLGIFFGGRARASATE